MALILVFSITALLLAALGIYGVVSYSVEQRTNEIGIRMALGARPANLAGLVLRQGMFPVVLGLLVGIGGALAAGRLVETLLFGVQPGDWRSLTLVLAILTATGSRHASFLHVGPPVSILCPLCGTSSSLLACFDAVGY